MDDATAGKLSSHRVYYCEPGGWGKIGTHSEMVINKICDETKIINGINCTKYIVNGGTPFEIWVPCLVSGNFVIVSKKIYSDLKHRVSNPRDYE